MYNFLEKAAFLQKYIFYIFIFVRKLIFLCKKDVFLQKKFL